MLWSRGWVSVGSFAGCFLVGALCVCVVWLLAPEPLCFHSFSGCLPLRSVFLLFLFCCFLAMPPFISPGPYFLSCGIVFSHLHYFPNFCVCSRLWKLGFTLFFGVRSPVSALFSPCSSVFFLSSLHTLWVCLLFPFTTMTFTLLLPTVSCTCSQLCFLGQFLHVERGRVILTMAICLFKIPSSGDCLTLAVLGLQIP